MSIETGASEEAILPPLPVITPESEPFWAGCAEGRLLLPRCEACQSFFYPASAFCPECWSDAWSWQECSGRGSIYSFVIFRRLYHRAFAALLPYAIAAVRLEEGPTLLSRLTDVEDLEAIECGQPVTVTFEAITDDIVLPLFRPSAELAH